MHKISNSFSKHRNSADVRKLGGVQMGEAAAKAISSIAIAIGTLACCWVTGSAYPAWGLVLIPTLWKAI